MTPLRIVGLVLIVAGLVAIGVGLASSDSLADRVSETFTGRYTKGTMAYFIGGGVTSALGVVLALVPSRKKA